jgi:hypothetical protein
VMEYAPTDMRHMHKTVGFLMFYTKSDINVGIALACRNIRSNIISSWVELVNNHPTRFVLLVCKA